MKTFARTSRALALTLTLSLAGGCPAFDWGAPDPEALANSVDAFMRYLRWGEYAKAKIFVHPESRRQYVLFVHRMEERLAIKSYAVEDVVISDAEEDETEASVLVRLTYTVKPSNVYRKHLVDTTWIPVEGGWALRFDEEEWNL